jgi:MoaA/NifB/PqqE/SkfB family radical SAM enzyme
MTQPFSVAGSLLHHPFQKLWREGFRELRDRRWMHRGLCARCGEWRYCQGGSMHDRSPDGKPMRCSAQRVRRALEARRGV